MRDIVIHSGDQEEDRKSYASVDWRKGIVVLGSDGDIYLRVFNGMVCLSGGSRGNMLSYTGNTTLADKGGGTTYRRILGQIRIVH